MPLPTFAYRLIGRFSMSRFDQRLHPLLYRVFGGRGALGRILGCEIVLLTTVGRRTGRFRTVALFAFPIEEPAGSWAVVGSRGGSGRIPAWYQNLIERPGVTVQARGVASPAIAREVAGDAYEAIFERASAAYPGYRLYRAEAPQHVPIVVLAPATTVSVAAAGPAANQVS